MNKKKFVRHSIIYFLLILGYVLLYVANLDSILHPDRELNPKSSVNFVYQQF